MVLFQPSSLYLVFPYLHISKGIISQGNLDFCIWWTPSTPCTHSWSNRSSLAMQTGHRILLVRWQLALNIQAPKNTQLLPYTFWRSAGRYKHKRLLVLEGNQNLRGSHVSDPFPQEKGPTSTLSQSITSYLWTQSWCFTQREGGVTQPVKVSVSCCRVSSGGDNPMIISCLIHSSPSMFLAGITREQVSQRTNDI